MYASDPLPTSSVTTANVRSSTLPVLRHMRSRPSGEAVSVSASNQVKLPHTTEWGSPFRSKRTDMTN